MSVLLTHRTESKAEYINVARQIYLETMQFLTRMSARYSRLLAESVAKEASRLRSECEKANSVFTSDEIRLKLREEHLLEAKAALDALDVMLSDCYDVMILNPSGCFTKSNGDTVSSGKAIKRLDSMAQSLGTLIDKEKALLKGLLDKLK